MPSFLPKEKTGTGGNPVKLTVTGKAYDQEKGTVKGQIMQAGLLAHHPRALGDTQ